MNIKTAIKEKSFELGFDLVGITNTDSIPAEHAKYLLNWVKNGYFADMQYMNRNVEKRINPEKLFDNANSIICVGLIYKPNFDTAAPSSNMCKVSDYAVYNDYHDYIKQQLRLLSDYIHQISPTNEVKTKICTDTAPVPERTLAMRAGLGFIGKNHMLINPELGVEIFLGEIYTTLQIEPDSPINLNCGQCKQCIDACPTGALSSDGNFYANKCISYLTIENKGDIPNEFKKQIGNSIYGCDRCIHACPYHKKAPAIKNSNLKCKPENMWLNPNEVLNWTEEIFKQRFENTPIERIGLDRLKRNAKTCLDNVNKLKQF